MTSAADVLNIAGAQVGYSRWNDPEAGTIYGRWYAHKTGSAYFGTSGVPYCAMFVSWVLAHAGTSLLGNGAVYAYVPWMVRDAGRAGRRVAFNDIQPGDVLCFDWDGDGVADHTGFAASTPSGSWVHTIEGNTSTGAAGSQSNGGMVARRVRSRGSIQAVIRPAYGGAAPSGSSGSVTVDGALGPESNKRMQEILGTVADGVISSQYAPNREYVPAAYGGWEWVSNAEGSLTIAALQRRLGVTDDGIIGPATVREWQKRLSVTADGYLGENTARAIQGALNRGGLW